MSIKKMSKEISQVTATLRYEGRMIRKYGGKVHKLRNKIKDLKPADKARATNLAQKYHKHLAHLVEVMEKYQTSANIVHRRLLDLHKEVGKPIK